MRTYPRRSFADPSPRAAEPGFRARTPPSRPRPSGMTALFVLLAIILASSVLARASVPPAAAEPGDASVGLEGASGVTSSEKLATSLTYRLAETWADLPRVSAPGHFLTPLDISSLPDRDVVVLGRAYGALSETGDNELALHILGPDGVPQQLVALGRELESAAHVDATFDGKLDVLGIATSAYGGGWTVRRIERQGDLVRAFALGADGTPVDNAASPNGDVLVTVNAAPDRIDVYSFDGDLVDQIVPDRMAIGGPDDPYRYSLYRLDVGPDGTIYVMAIAQRDCPPGPPSRPTRPPTATPTPRPSYGSDPSPAASELAHQHGEYELDQIDLPCTKSIVLIFEPDHSFREEVPNEHTTDIAAGPSGVFVSTSRPGFRRPAQRVYELFEQVGVLQYRVPDPLDIPIPYSAPELQLDVDSDGLVNAAGNLGGTFYRGGAKLGDPTAGLAPSAQPGIALGMTDNPPLAGPHYPRRIDAASEVVLLEGPYQRYGEGDIANTGTDVDHDSTAIQRWSLTGTPQSQVIHREKLLRDGAEGSDAYNILAPLVDIAFDGTDLFAISSQIVWQRSDALPPAWYRHIPGAHFVAVSADDGRVAVLNASGRRVLVLGADGRFLYDKPIAWDWSKRLASDLALSGDRVYLADQGRNVVMVRGIDGTDYGEWPTVDGPFRIAVGPQGHVFVLGRGGFGMEYTPDGELLATWRVPADHDGVPADGYDIAVGDDGRAYVNFLGLEKPEAGSEPPGNGRGYDIPAGGVWVFEPVEIEDPNLPDPAQKSCLARPEKVSSPKVVLLGEEVEIALDVDGYCPGHHAPQQLIIVLDTSYSMHDLFYPDYPGPGALTRAQLILEALLSSIDPQTIEIGLITFSGGAGMEVPLPGDLGLVRSRVVTRRADGDTQLATGIRLARAELTGPRGNRDVKQSILLVSDGLFKDDPEFAVREAQADGIEVSALVLSTPGFDDAARAALEAVVGDPELIFVDPIPETVGDVIEEVSAYVPNLGLFETITIEDVLPSNMQYVSGSALPTADYDSGSRTLRWSLDQVTAAEGIRLRYRVKPEEPGQWPTNARADASYIDAWENEGQLAFPVPWVFVLAPDVVVTPTPIPPTPTATATRRPTLTIYLPLAERPPLCERKVIHTDVVLALDMSTSMYRLTSAGRTKHEAAIHAARMFMSFLDLKADDEGRYDQVALVGFNDRAWIQQGLTSDRAALDRALDGMLAEVREGTRLDLVFREAQKELDGVRRRSGNQPALILLTDGLPNRVPTPVPSGRQEDTVLQAAQRVKDLGTTVYTIGLGKPDDLWPKLLEAAASSPSMYYYAPDGEDLLDIYRRIFIRLVCDNE